MLDAGAPDECRWEVVEPTPLNPDDWVEVGGVWYTVTSGPEMALTAGAERYAAWCLDECQMDGEILAKGPQYVALGTLPRVTMGIDGRALFGAVGCFAVA